jgi:arsenate reductase-like glutaredoxin family protein
MGIQVFGTKKSHDTRKAEMFFKERKIPFQSVDLTEKGMSRGELESVARAVGLDALIDRDGKEYEKRGLKYMAFDALELLGREPLLLKQPVVRDGKRATVGYRPEEWKNWLA